MPQAYRRTELTLRTNDRILKCLLPVNVIGKSIRVLAKLPNQLGMLIRVKPTFENRPAT